MCKKCFGLFLVPSHLTRKKTHKNELKNEFSLDGYTQNFRELIEIKGITYNSKTLLKHNYVL